MQVNLNTSKEAPNLFGKDSRIFEKTFKKNYKKKTLGNLFSCLIEGNEYFGFLFVLTNTFQKSPCIFVLKNNCNALVDTSECTHIYRKGTRMLSLAMLSLATVSKI